MVCAVVAICWSMYEPLKVQYQASREYRGLEREYDQVNARNRRLRSEIEDLKKPEGVERIARENLGLTRPGENVYIVLPSQASSGQPAAAAPDAGTAGARTTTKAASDPLTILLDAIFDVGR